MLVVYLYYPRSRIVVHSDPDCARIQQHAKAGQRTVIITDATAEQELGMFRRDDGHQFGSTAEFNDMWVRIDLGKPRAEHDLVRRIHGLLGSRYVPFANAEVERCC